jgi:hypothetical protein
MEHVRTGAHLRDGCFLLATSPSATCVYARGVTRIGVCC